MSKGKTTHARIDKMILSKCKTEYPDYSANDIFKLGYTTLKGINKVGSFMYGKSIWKAKKK